MAVLRFHKMFFFLSDLLDFFPCILRAEKTKEEYTMKNKKSYPYLRVVETEAPRYPNAADHNYFARKALDVMTAIASGFGLFSAMIFLVTMI